MDKGKFIIHLNWCLHPGLIFAAASACAGNITYLEIAGVPLEWEEEDVGAIRKVQEEEFLNFNWGALWKPLVNLRTISFNQMPSGEGGDIFEDVKMSPPIPFPKHVTRATVTDCESLQPFAIEALPPTIKYLEVGFTNWPPVFPLWTSRANSHLKYTYDGKMGPVERKYFVTGLKRRLKRYSGGGKLTLALKEYDPEKFECDEFDVQSVMAYLVRCKKFDAVRLFTGMDGELKEWVG